MTQYFPSEAKSGLDQRLLKSIPGSSLDRNLTMAAHHLLAALKKRTAHITVQAGSLAAAKAGYPGQTRYAKLMNRGDFPQALIKTVLLDANGDKVDVALVSKRYSDGGVLWLIAWSHRIMDMDPIPRQVSLDKPVALRIDLNGGDRASLYVSPPGGTVRELSIVPNAHRWVNALNTPGAYRFEVVVSREKGTQIGALFSVFVDAPPPDMPELTTSHPRLPALKEIEDELHLELNDLRKRRGLAPLKRFRLFEPLARQHSKMMAYTGLVAHKIPGVGAGVPSMASELAHPRAEFFENVAASFSVREIMDLTIDSPGHLSTLLCEECTHVSIGAAVESKKTRHPRVFVTWEMMRFPQGQPRVIQRLAPKR